MKREFFNIGTMEIPLIQLRSVKWSVNNIFLSLLPYSAMPSNQRNLVGLILSPTYLNNNEFCIYIDGAVSKRAANQNYISQHLSSIGIKHRKIKCSRTIHIKSDVLFFLKMCI